MNFYPRSPRGERRGSLSGLPARKKISIHAPRVGSDGDLVHVDALDGEFLSTLPAWGATATRSTGHHARANFYPRSPRGERPDVCNHMGDKIQISIHAPRVGSDNFLEQIGYYVPYISIHAPRVGSDMVLLSE